MLPAGDPLGACEFLSVAELDGQRPEARIWLAAPVAQLEIEELLESAIVTEPLVAFDDRSGAIRAVRQRRLGKLVLQEAPLPSPDPDAIATALLAAVRSRGLQVLSWAEAARSLRDRIRFLAGRDASTEWPALDDETLLATLEAWLLPHLPGVRGLAQLGRLDLAAILSSSLDWARLQELERRAPTQLQVPTGSRVAIDYSGETPSAAVRVQELFGLTTHPTVDDGKLPILLELLSPAQRPIQLTRDLPGFWSGSWKAVRADLRGRYPRHSWPEDPATAAPTSRAKPRK